MTSSTVPIQVARADCTSWNSTYWASTLQRRRSRRSITSLSTTTVTASTSRLAISEVSIACELQKEPKRKSEPAASAITTTPERGGDR